MNNPDTYYFRHEVSNSDLSWLKNQLYPRVMPDTTNAFRFGNLIDAMITELHRVDFYKKTLDGEQCDIAEFERAEAMKKAFLQDNFCQLIYTNAAGQKVMTRRLQMNFRGIEFYLNARCKWDLWRTDWGWGGDIKSTTAETQRQFEDAARYFDYDRQRYYYMRISKAERDVLIGISKKNFKVFKIFINRNTSFYKDGERKCSELAFKWNTMFGEDKNIITY